MPRVEVNGVNLSYELQGQGQPVVLIHGWTFNKGAWQHQLPALARKYRVLAYDQRGHGDSDKPRGEYTVEVLAEDASALMRKLDLGPAAVLGHSLGGMVAQQLVLSHPDQVKALVLYGTSCQPAKAGGFDRQAEARRVEEKGLKEFLKDADKLWYAPGFDPKLVEAFTAEELRTPDYVAAACMRAVGNFDLCPRLGEIKVPTLVIVGEHDVRQPIAEEERLNRLIPDAWLKIVRGGAHAVNIEQPAAFNVALLGFLDMVL